MNCSTHIYGWKHGDHNEPASVRLALPTRYTTMSEDKGSPKIGVDLALKAEAKAELKGEVPAKSLGRLVDALTDMFLPFSEKRGLRGDQIRLQREEVAIQVAMLAKKRLLIENSEANEVPTKILIPLIEKSSQEDIENKIMIERWANLLASAAKDNSAHPRLVQVLSEMERSQVEFMELISVNKKDDWQYPLREFGDSFINMETWAVEDFIKDYQRKRFKTGEKAVEDLAVYFDRPGSITISAGIDNYIIEHEYDKNLSFDIDICSSLGLVQSRTINIRAIVSGQKEQGYISFCHLSALGVKLIETCSPDTVKQLNC